MIAAPLARSLLFAAALAMFEFAQPAAAQSTSDWEYSDSRCHEIDEDEIDAFWEEHGEEPFFDREAFECDNNWLRAEEYLAERIRLLELPQLIYRDLDLDEGDTAEIYLRTVGNGRVLQVHCRYRALDDYEHRMESRGGTVTVYSPNSWVDDPPQFVRLQLSRSDCEYLREVLDMEDATDIPASAYSVTNVIILEIGPSLTEFQDVDGELFYWYRNAGDSLQDPERGQAESRIHALLYYWSQRAGEHGRDLDIPRAVLRD